MWVGNPSQPKTYRSPWFQEGVGAAGQGLTNVQPKLSKQRLDQFGYLIDDGEKQRAIPGPIIRDMPLDSKQYKEEYYRLPGQVYYPELDKHYSEGVFYNQQSTTSPGLYYGYEAAPYWKYGQWQYIYPEYLVLDSSPIAGNFTEDNSGKFLLKRTSGYEFVSPSATTGGVPSNYIYTQSPRYAWFVSYMPCYCINGKCFPSPLCSWNLSFRSMSYGIDWATITPQFVDLSPFTWCLSCTTQSSYWLAYNLNLSDYPTSGSFHFVKGDNNSVTVSVPAPTGNPTTDANALRVALQNGMTTLGDIFGSAIQYDPNLPNFTLRCMSNLYAEVKLKSNTTNVDASLVPFVDAPLVPFNGFNTVFQFVPDQVFPSIQEGNEIPSGVNGVGKDSRDIGYFENKYYEGVPDYGEVLFYLPNMYAQADPRFPGISFGSISFKKPMRFRLHTKIISCRTSVEPYGSERSYPGWSVPEYIPPDHRVGLFGETNGVRAPFTIASNTKITLTPVYL